MNKEKEYFDFHTEMSIIKSVTRIIGFGFFFLGDLTTAASVLIIAEIIGIIEET